MKYFVWVKGLRGPEGQIWEEKEMTVDGKPAKTLSVNPIPVNDKRNVAQLILDYPYDSPSVNDNEAKP